MDKNKFRNRSALMGTLCLLVVAMEGKDDLTRFGMIVFFVIMVILVIMSHMYPEYFREEEE